MDKAASTFGQVGMDKGYIRCFQQFASLQVGGQAASGGIASPCWASR